MKNKKEIAELIYTKLKTGNIKNTIYTIYDAFKEEKTEDIGFTKTPLLNATGKELGKLLLKDSWELKKLMELWKNGKRDEKLIVISAIGEISKHDYDNSKQFVLNILNDISDWEICDQLALRVVANLAVKNQKEIFTLMYKWIKSKNKWIKRLAIATLPAYIRTKPKESKISLYLLDKVMQENDKNIKKAIGWALREITKKDKKSVFEFLKKWAKIKNKNTNSIIKEGMKKLLQKEQNELNSMIKNHDK